MSERSRGLIIADKSVGTKFSMKIRTSKLRDAIVAFAESRGYQHEESNNRILVWTDGEPKRKFDAAMFSDLRKTCAADFVDADKENFSAAKIERLERKLADLKKSAATPERKRDK